MAFKFAVGDRVEKTTGCGSMGVVVSHFVTVAGKRRYVVEFRGPGGELMLHIFNGAQLTKHQKVE